MWLHTTPWSENRIREQKAQKWFYFYILRLAPRIIIRMFALEAWVVEVNRKNNHALMKIYVQTPRHVGHDDDDGYRLSVFRQAFWCSIVGNVTGRFITGGFASILRWFRSVDGTLCGAQWTTRIDNNETDVWNISWHFWRIKGCAFSDYVITLGLLE